MDLVPVGIFHVQLSNTQHIYTAGQIGDLSQSTGKASPVLRTTRSSAYPASCRSQAAIPGNTVGDLVGVSDMIREHHPVSVLQHSASLKSLGNSLTFPGG